MSRVRLFWVLALLASAGCGSFTSITPEESGVTRYRVGDRIVYRYAGELLAREVLLEERITDVNGLRLRIEVTARRTDEAGAEEMRRWIQVVTDTESNRTSNHVDELYEVGSDGTARRLANEGNADLHELYAWTLPDLDWGDPGDEHHESRVLTLAGASFTCDVATTALPHVGDDASVSLSECPALVWTNGPASISRGGVTVWSVEVVELEGGP